MADSGKIKPVPLDTVYLHLTSRCPFRCVYCYLDEYLDTSGETSTNLWIDLFPLLVALKPRKVVFTGGEPLMRGDILALLRGINTLNREHQIELALDTSGIGLTPELARAMAGLVDRVRLSLDGPEEINDLQRGPGSYGIAMKAFSNLTDAGFEPEVGITLTSRNLSSIHEFTNYLVNMGCRNISISRLRPIGRACHHPEWVPDRKEMREAVDEVRASLGIPLETIQENVGTGHTCGVGRFLSVLPDGSAYPCHVLHLPEFRLGNIFTDRPEYVCRPEGLLGKLASLDLMKLSRSYPVLMELGESDVCLGYVYRKTASSPVWQYILDGLLQRSKN